MWSSKVSWRIFTVMQSHLLAMVKYVALLFAGLAMHVVHPHLAPVLDFFAEVTGKVGLYNPLMFQTHVGCPWMWIPALIWMFHRALLMVQVMIGAETIHTAGACQLPPC
mmetsp:Transcript_81031/g.194392  ORF Transcript_81031/g.194392 Transcript_81031/m.194392 type:complete len:109 (+) Transcript_81031:573-899(+)